MREREREEVKEREGYKEKEKKEVYLLSLTLCSRCLSSGAGDVAFVDHLALENIEGRCKSSNTVLLMNSSRMFLIGRFLI